MIPNESSLPRLYLKQGEMSILEHPALVSTILGSCVAVTLFNKRLGIAAISHALLPHCKRRAYRNHVSDLLSDECASCHEAFKYVDCSVSMMVEAFTRFGIVPSETQVQLYGGAKMFRANGTKSALTVGGQNAAVAQKVIADHGLALFKSDIGGSVGRKIYFNTQTGNVLLQKMRKFSADDFRADFESARGGWHAPKEKDPGSRC